MRPAATAHRPRAHTFAARRAGAALGRPGAERRLLGMLEAAAAARSRDARLRSARMAHVYRGARGCEQDERRPGLVSTTHGRGGDTPATAVGSNAPSGRGTAFFFLEKEAEANTEQYPREGSIHSPLSTGYTHIVSSLAVQREAGYGLWLFAHTLSFP